MVSSILPLWNPSHCLGWFLLQIRKGNVCQPWYWWNWNSYSNNSTSARLYSYCSVGSECHTLHLKKKKSNVARAIRNQILSGHLCLNYYVGSWELKMSSWQLWQNPGGSSFLQTDKTRRDKLSEIVHFFCWKTGKLLHQNELPMSNHF